MLGTGTIFTSKVFHFLQNVETVTGFLLGFFLIIIVVARRD